MRTAALFFVKSVVILIVFPSTPFTFQFSVFTFHLSSPLFIFSDFFTIFVQEQNQIYYEDRTSTGGLYW